MAPRAEQKCCCQLELPCESSKFAFRTLHNGMFWLVFWCPHFYHLPNSDCWVCWCIVKLRFVSKINYGIYFLCERLPLTVAKNHLTPSTKKHCLQWITSRDVCSLPPWVGGRLYVIHKSKWKQQLYIWNNSWQSRMDKEQLSIQRLARWRSSCDLVLLA